MTQRNSKPVQINPRMRDSVFRVIFLLFLSTWMVAFSAYGQDLTFSARPGLFVDPFNLTIESQPLENNNAVQVDAAPLEGIIRYTTNGTEPNRNSTSYVGPLRIDSSVWIRARFYSANGEEGPVTGASYLRTSENILTVDSNLPIIVIHSYQGNIVADTKRATYLNFFDVDPVTGRASLGDEPKFQTRSGAELRGSSSLEFPKNSIGLETRGEDDLDVDIDWMGLPSEADWVLYAPYTDKTLMRNALVYEISREMGRYAPRTRFVEVYLKNGPGNLTSGQYLGVYVVTEKIKRDRNRVDMDSLDPDELTGDDVTGGYIFKKDRLDPGDRGFTVRRSGTFAYVDPKERTIPEEQSFYLRSYLNQMENALYGANFRDVENGYQSYLDDGSFIDQHILVESFKNIDGYRLSSFYHKDRNGKLMMGPAWDYNLSLGNANYASGWQTNGWYYPQLGSDQYPWFGRLFQDPDFQQKYVDRWAELRVGVYKTDKMLSRVDEIVEELDEAQRRNFAKWRIMGTYVWPNWYVGRNYAAEINFMKTWIEGRWAWMDSQFVRRPSSILDPGLIIPGAELQLTSENESGLIYYTLDGSDPRASGGSVSSGAEIYRGPIELNETSHLVARVRAGQDWSAPLSLVFYTRLPDLRISEINYHPADPRVGEEAYSESDFEFVEIENIGSEALNLSGFKLLGGVDFVFTEGELQAGQFGVLVGKPEAFRLRYGNEALILGTLDRRLANSGERIRLLGPLNEPIQDFRYDDVNPWPLAADGIGFTLTPALDWVDQIPGTRSADPNRPEFWRGSSEWGGSPGRKDPAPLAAPIRITEVFPTPGNFQNEGIELFNPTANEVNLSGWLISDDLAEPMKASLPVGTVIGAGSYIWISESIFGSAFGLSSRGESVYLFSSDTSGNLTGYSYGFEFEAVPEGMSWGSFEMDSGLFFDFLLKQPTPAEVNAAPVSGPVVISEVVFLRGEDLGSSPAFIEIKNISESAVELKGSDPSVPGWTFWVDGTRWEFPVNTVLEAGSIQLLTPVTRGVFANAYPGVDLALVIDNVFSGKANATVFGDDFGLARPWSEDPADRDRFVWVDRVNLDDFAYWPPNAAVDTRFIERKSLGGFAQDPNNWFSTISPTPGVDADSNQPPWIEVEPELVFNEGRFPLHVFLDVNVGDDGRPENPGKIATHWELVSQSQSDRWIWESTEGSSVRAWIMGPGSYELKIQASDGALTNFSHRTVTANILPLTRELISSGDEWRYSDTGATDFGTSWRGLDFDDSTWKVGASQLGYGDGDEVTEVGYGPVPASKYITTYFRKTFEVEDSEDVNQLRLGLLRDDGAAVYLNGQEIARSNLPDGAIDFNTFATVSVALDEENEFSQFQVPTELLVPGANQLSVEVHQFNRSSSDMSFDLRLEADFADRNIAPRINFPDSQEIPIVGMPFRLEANVVDDGAPNAQGKVSLIWTQISGPADVEFDPENLSHTWVTFSDPGLYQLRLTVSDGQSLVSRELEILVGSNTYDQWAAGFFTDLELLDPNISAEDADPDNDGATNREEFLAGTHPWDELSVLAIQSVEIVDGNLSFAFTRLPGKNYRIQFLEILAEAVNQWTEWVQVPVDPQQNSPEEYPVIDGLDASGAKFYRVEVPEL